MTNHRIKKTVLLFGEGGKEERFFRFLEDTNRFKAISHEWSIYTDHASGSSCREVLKKCIKVIVERSYELVMCFIDTDKLYSDFPNKHEKERKDLEELAKQNSIKIIWQEKNHEDELRVATKGKIKGKGRMKERLKLHEKKLENSNFVKRIFAHFKLS